MILSPSFFSKTWPQREISGLLATEGGNDKKILPVWHNVTAGDVAKFSPIIADRIGVDTSRGLQAVAEEIVTASFPNRAKDLPLSNMIVTTEEQAIAAKTGLRELLDRQSSL